MPLKTILRIAGIYQRCRKPEEIQEACDAQDEIDENRERLIGKIEGKLKSESPEEELLTIRSKLN